MELEKILKIRNKFLKTKNKEIFITELLTLTEVEQSLLVGLLLEEYTWDEINGAVIDELLDVLREPVLKPICKKCRKLLIDDNDFFNENIKKLIKLIK